MLQADLTFLYGESVARCTHHIDKHYVGYQTLQYMAAGVVDLAIDHQKYVLKGRWFWSAYPGPRISFHCGEGHKTWVHRYIAFTGPLVNRWTADGLFPIAPQPSPRGHDFGPRFDRMLELSREPSRASQLRAIHLIEGILLDLAEYRATHPPHEPWIDRAMARLADEEIDCPSLAAELGVSESTLRRRFKETTGVSPIEFRIQQRIATARRLLSETDSPVKTVAASLGYRDVYFFSRQFAKVVGVPPAVYRRSRQG